MADPLATEVMPKVRFGPVSVAHCAVRLYCNMSVRIRPLPLIRGGEPRDHLEIWHLGRAFVVFNRLEYIGTFLGCTFQFSRTWTLYVRQKAEGGGSTDVRLGPYDLSLFRIESCSSGRNWFCSHSSSLLCENLRDMKCSRRHFKLVT
jgi:hypothetical protein